MVQLVLTPTPVLGKIGDQIVVTSILAWCQLILPKAYVCQLKAAASRVYTNLLGACGSWIWLLSSLHQQNL